MFLNLLQLFRGDKQIDHPILGQLSCKTLQEAYKNCMSFIDNEQYQQKQCRPYYNLCILPYDYLAVSCFQVKDDVEFQQFIDDKIDERRRLIKFLRENKSQLPELQKSNQQQFFNLFQFIDNEDGQEEQAKNFYQKQQQDNKKYL
ncbi:unnamed protein product (macronuclear) [Paramecium tetraurelia]|uniref:Uncharacterized protein n=1 Tax=Paramecium tetraurelia TaxID=5888 RepID=A0DKA7_PARTE|nr:uncharacterized protein GSPATT00017803001 [Paramecium tetraurelia]CAK83474.1 unnamed protein product [Paramecium tetraurelia]|eukprot:XP_001450871.1 hypothetical protein (macronuclear) [Paramecium tetraurelia strain d4-2]